MKKALLGVEIPDTLRQALKMQAIKEGKTLKDLTINVLTEYLKNNKEGVN